MLETGIKVHLGTSEAEEPSKGIITGRVSAAVT